MERKSKKKSYASVHTASVVQATSAASKAGNRTRSTRAWGAQHAHLPRRSRVGAARAAPADAANSTCTGRRKAGPAPPSTRRDAPARRHEGRLCHEGRFPSPPLHGATAAPASPPTPRRPSRSTHSATRPPRSAPHCLQHNSAARVSRRGGGGYAAGGWAGGPAHGGGEGNGPKGGVGRGPAGWARGGLSPSLLFCFSFIIFLFCYWFI